MMETQRRVLDSLRVSEAYLVRHGFHGYDPYDGLTSPLVANPVARRSRSVRRMLQQSLKRLPINARPILGIRPGYNPVTLGLAAHAYANLSLADTDRAEYHREQARFCVDELARLVAPGYSGACWGYDFEWETREVTIPVGTPTIVATGFVTNGLFHVGRTLGVSKPLEMCLSATQFLRNDLPARESRDGLCWSYSPLDASSVVNATMKGARLCAQVYESTRSMELSRLAERAVAFAAAHQRSDGSWPYAVGDSRSWSDNFHTGYVLDCLVEYAERTGDQSYADVTLRGWRHYRRDFFTEEGLPKYFSNRLYPIDATACAQSILTLCTFGDISTAERVALWAIDHMQRGDGAFAYQVHRRYTNWIPYVRWSVAWMFCALARLAVDLGSQA